MKWLIKSLFKICLCLVLLMLGLLYYFRSVSPMQPKIKSSVEIQMKKFHVHPLSYDQIPVGYRNAVIATEDRRFYWDPGIDPEGMIRSLIVDVKKDGYVEGGSTITQQLVDNTLMQRENTLIYKVKQTFYAIGIYDTVSKKQTFAMYANVIYFGQGAYGLYNASETYFGVKPAQLNQGELAMLAGIPNSPNNFNPLHHLSAAKKRQKEVVQNMVDVNIVTKKQAQHILAEPIKLKGKK